MLLLAHEIPVTLEVLDTNDNVLSGMTATLRHLDEERAELYLCSGTTLSCLHWGSHMRLHVTDGQQKYRILGTVIQHVLPSPSEDENGSMLPESLTIRVWDCLTEDERRSLPRRAQRFPVYFCLPEDGANAVSDGVFEDEIWREGWSVDIGGGGLRFRIQGIIDFPQHITLRFTLPLPGTANEAQSDGKQSFCLQGRVLRTNPCGRHADGLEVAVHFERLTVAEGCALADYLSA